ncbi:thioredoxin family protein [Archangium lansingense]|uniref:Thioredoxin family protein n=1 Tax=Archangium lansingense TaxID=2995310 RepID=A0ABT4A740_9BACT|nr:thioredoxin family protein [Archangium lansinium]MCY1077440.1 thioredoxin family protein [Archangium lansinium]
MRHAWILLLLLSALTVGCATARTDPGARGTPSAPGSMPEFIENDYAAALREARTRHLPLLIKVWAPWCHACLSIQANVLPHPSVAPFAARYVWLAIDTDDPANAAFLQRFPIDTWPTVLVIDPGGETVLARTVGGASVEQFVSLLEHGLRASQGQLEAADKALVLADSHSAAGNHAEAVLAYREALKKAPAGWPARARAVTTLLNSLGAAGESESCTRTALEELPQLQAAEDQTKVAAVGVACSLDLPEGDSAALRGQLVLAAERTLRLPPEAVEPDLRSSLYESLVEARQMNGDEAGATALAEEWLVFLERSAGRERTPQEKTVFDGHRVMAALSLGRPEQAVPALEESEKALPSDDNPPTRLAMLYLQAGRLEEALKANDRALALARGAARMRVLNLRSDILLARGDRSGAEECLRKAIAEGRTAADMSSRRQLVWLEKKLKAFDGAEAGSAR